LFGKSEWQWVHIIGGNVLEAQFAKVFQSKAV